MIANKYFVLAVVASVLLSVAMTVAEESNEKTFGSQVMGGLKKVKDAVASGISKIPIIGNLASKTTPSPEVKADDSAAKDSEPAADGQESASEATATNEPGQT